MTKLTVEATILLGVLSLVIAYQSFQLNKTRETKKDSKQEAKLQAQLDYISKGVDDIRIDLKANEKQMAQLSERVTRVEESSKQAHRRIDKLERSGE